MSTASQDPGPHRSYSSENAAGAGALAPQDPRQAITYPHVYEERIAVTRRVVLV